MFSRKLRIGERFLKKSSKAGHTILSVNSMLASLNSFLVFCGRADCKVKLYRVQKKTYLAANRELSKAEYQRLLHAAGHIMSWKNTP